MKIRQKLMKAGKEAYLIMADEISPGMLEGYDFDVLVNTACPRIVYDDHENYRIRMINWFEVDYITGERSIEDLINCYNIL